MTFAAEKRSQEDIRKAVNGQMNENETARETLTDDEEFEVFIVII